MVKEEKLRMLVWLDVLVTRRVLVRETGEELVFQLTGLEPRPWARRVEGRPADVGAD